MFSFYKELPKPKMVMQLQERSSNLWTTSTMQWPEETALIPVASSHATPFAVNGLKNVAPLYQWCIITIKHHSHTIASTMLLEQLILYSKSMFMKSPLNATTHGLDQFFLIPKLYSPFLALLLHLCTEQSQSYSLINFRYKLTNLKDIYVSLRVLKF